jgi:AcrR family transcriptional regulator
MPKETFWNLPEEKRQRIIDLAVAEFAAHDYAVASLSRIVARAGIAKGSIYQYFEDKQDLFLYLLDLSIEQRLALMREMETPAVREDLFAFVRWQLGASLRAGVAYPQLSQLGNRAFTGNLPFQPLIARRAEAIVRDHRDRLFALLRQGVARGDLAPDLDPELAAFVVATLVGNIGVFLFQRLGLDPTRHGEIDIARIDTTVAEQTFDQLVRILQLGVARPPPG